MAGIFDKFALYLLEQHIRTLYGLIINLRMLAVVSMFQINFGLYANNKSMANWVIEFHALKLQIQTI